MSRASAAEREAERNETRDPAQELRSALWLPVAIRRVALGPGSRCARPGHERAQSRRAKRTVARSRIHDVKQRSVVRSRGAFVRPGSSLFLSRPPQRGVGGAPTGALCLFVARVRRDHSAPRRGAARPMTRDARLSALHRGDFRPGPRFHLRHCLRIRAASSSQPGRRAWRAVSRTSRVRGYEPRPQDATPRSAFRIVSGDAPHERGCESYTINPLRSQVNIFVS